MKPELTPSLAFGLLVILASVSCQPNIEPTMTTLPSTITVSTTLPESLLEPLATSPLPTATMEVKETTLTPTEITPTNSPTVVQTLATPLPTFTPPTIIRVTLTPLPTLAIEELEKAVEELFADPMNCDVPCWWGAIPNVTTGIEIQQVLTLYKFTTRERYDNQMIPNLIEVWVGFDENQNQYDFRVMYSFENDVLKGILVERARPLVEIIGRYGQPDEVWLSTDGAIRDGNLAVRLNAIYLQEGMAVGYVVNGILQNDMIVGCFTGEEPGRLQLKTPDNSANYLGFRGIFEVDRLYLPLGEATDLALEEFTQSFHDSLIPFCLETPTELWN